MVMPTDLWALPSPTAPKPAMALGGDWVDQTYAAVATTPEPPEWRKYGWPSEAEYMAAGSPRVSYAEYQAQQQAALAPPSPFTAGLPADLLAQAQQTIANPAAFAPPVPPPAPPFAPQGPSLEYLPQYAAPAAPGGATPPMQPPYTPQGPSLDYLPQYAAPAMPAGVSEFVTAPEGTLRAQLQEQRQGEPVSLAGNLAEFVLDERGNPVSRFIADEVRPVAGEVGQAVGTVLGYTPPGQVVDALLSPLGVNIGDVGETAAELLTPASPLDLALSVFIPATADWADAWRLAKSSGLVDDAGRLIAGVTRQQADNVLRQAGKSYDELLQAVRALPADETGMARVPFGPEDVGRGIDEAAGAAPSAAPPPAGAAGGQPPPGVTPAAPASGVDEALTSAVAPPAGAVDELVTGVGGIPPASTAPAPAAPPPGMPPPGPTTALGEPPLNPVKRLTDLVDQARPLPAQTEAVRKAERAQRVAAANRILEEGGFTPEAFGAAKGPLAGEYSRAAFDPVAPNFAPEEIQQFRNMIGESDLRTFEQINVNDALNKVLDGRLNEVRQFEIALLDKVYGTDFALSVAKKAAPPSLADKAYEWWLASILSGPITQARNIVGNTAAAMTAPVERLGAAVLEAPVARLQGRAAERFWEEVPAQVVGMTHGVADGAAAALRAIKAGFGESALTESVRAPAIGGLTGRIVRAPFTALEAMDSFFGAINFEGAYRALAVRTARSEGLTGEMLRLRVADLLSNRTDDLIEQATEAKLYRLFRDDPSRIGQAVMSAREKYKPLNFLIPFARTPDRLVAYGIKRSPLGLLDLPMWQRLVKGNPGAVDELAQTLIGSSVAAGLAGLVASGQLEITGAFPSGAAERDRWYRAGRLPFAVKLPGIGWTQYSQVPGLDTTLSTLASAVDTFKAGGNIERLVGETAGSIAQNIFDKSYVSGLADFMEIFSSGISDPYEAAQRWASRQIAGFVPFSAAARQTSQFFDRGVYRPEGFVENIATGVGLGGLAGVPPRLTAFGEEASRPIPSPVSVSPDTQVAVDRALGAAGVEVGFAGKSIGGRALTTDERFAYQQALGRNIYDALYTTVSNQAFERLSTVQQAEVLDKTIDKARGAIQGQITSLLKSERFQALPPDKQNEVLLALLKKLGEVRGRESPVSGELVR